MSRIGVTVHPAFVADRTPPQTTSTFRTPRRGLAALEANRPEAGVRRPSAAPLICALIALGLAAGAIAAALVHALS